MKPNADKAGDDNARDATKILRAGHSPCSNASLYKGQQLRGCGQSGSWGQESQGRLCSLCGDSPALLTQLSEVGYFPWEKGAFFLCTKLLVLPAIPWEGLHMPREVTFSEVALISNLHRHVL